jgi:hypothetical protein
MPRRPSSSTVHPSVSPSRSLNVSDEITPLLRKASRSLSNTFYGEPRVARFSDNPDAISSEEGDGEEGTDDEIDGEGGREVEVYIPGKSTFMQTVSC